MDLSWLWPWLACVGLAAITLFTRAFFLIPEREVPLPQWLKRGLKYAPLAALAAVIAPEIVMTNGRLISTVVDARLPALACAVMYFTSAASWERSRLAWRSICHCISAWAGRRSAAESGRERPAPRLKPDYRRLPMPRIAGAPARCRGGHAAYNGRALPLFVSNPWRSPPIATPPS